MHNRLLIAVGLGLVAAVVFVSAATGPMFIRFLLFLVTPLPIFLAGLGWGPRAAMIAGAAGSALVFILGPPAALIFAASQAVPAIVLTHLALLSRDAAASPGAAPQREWYPPGRLVLWAAVMAGIPAVLWLVALGGDVTTLKSTLEPLVSDLIKSEMQQGGGASALGEDDIKTIVAVIVAMLPSASAMSWMGALLLNLWLAGRIMLSSGQLTRPWPDLATIGYPPGTPLALAVTVATSFVGGPLGMAASSFAGTFFFAYLLLGLAVIHYLSRGTTWRPFLLWTLYAALIVTTVWSALPIVLLGLAETILHLRARRAARGSGPTT